jgi:hypothetical protein
MSQALALTADDLRDIIASAVTAAVAESKKPAPPTEQELAQIAQDQQMRKDTAQDVLRAQANKLANQKVCSHEHPKREGSQSHCVWVKEENPASPGYILCQLCQGKVRPEVPAEQRMDTQAIYDTQMFNKLFQDCLDTSMQ